MRIRIVIVIVIRIGILFNGRVSTLRKRGSSFKQVAARGNNCKMFATGVKLVRPTFGLSKSKTGVKSETAKLTPLSQQMALLFVCNLSANQITNQ